jgi:hypothetical protein
MPQKLNGTSSRALGRKSARGWGIAPTIRNTIPPTSFLRAADLREDPLHQFLCDPTAVGLRPGHFPPTIATDAGNGEPFSIQRPVFDADGELFGVLYRQGNLGGLVVLVQIG